MSYEINNDDIKRFIVSLDKAIKFSYATNEANDQNFPKILLGESRDYLDNEKEEDILKYARDKEFWEKLIWG